MCEESEYNGIHDQRARMQQLEKHVNKGQAQKVMVETVHGIKQDVVFTSYPEGITVEESETLESLVKRVQN